MDSLTITRPDDWHLHLREGEALKTTVPHSARCFKRAIIMPNLIPPVTTVEQACGYREKILAAIPPDVLHGQSSFHPLMTLYLTDLTAKDEILKINQSEEVVAVKLYPAGVTTNAEFGVTNIEKIYPILETMVAEDIPLLIHGEVTDPDVDVFDREKIFIETVLRPLQQSFPELRIVLEHITTSDAVDYVMSAPQTLAATITAHHLLISRNAMFAGGIQPHHYCLPVLKRETHRQALLKAAASGNPKFFLGTDSAPHEKNRKESACGCAGIYSAHAAMAFYAEAFEQVNALDKLEGFASFHGADFYRLPRNQEQIIIRRKKQKVPAEFTYQNGSLVPLRAGGEINWSIDYG